ncbi:MAG: hypothetical protein KatS3mg001_090 [Candidatus Pacearchaeota archaeon]|nr:MAG: hypothetical protein KatS3mg001_090 [Candidatus Pacearchaeota archaeon]
MATVLKLEERIKQETKFPDYVGKGKFIESLTENQIYALEKKYLLRDDSGEICETPAEAVYRIARTMAEVERKYGASNEEIDFFTKQFYELIANGYFSPAGRVWTNAGTEIKALFNCYVLPVEDSMDLEDDGNIFMAVAKAAIVHKNGGGTGYNFSELRPRGSYVRKSKGIASGPVSFIEQFDKETEIINSGNRRGANMGILDVTHPDILDFIYAKSVKGKLTNFNVSVGATDDFMRAVENNGFYNLEFPKGNPFKYTDLERIIKNIEENKIGGAEVGSSPEPCSLKIDLSEGKVIPGKTKVIDSYSGKIAGKVDENGNIQLSANYVMNLIAELAHKTGDPGMIFLDTINKDNPLPKKGPIRATNPCGEQPLHPYDACNLGSVILSNMIREENGKKDIDWKRLEETVRIATRFMDNVNDANRGPLPEIERTVLSHRRIGLGVMGWADMLAELGIPYDSEKARELAKQIMGFITETAKKTSVELAKEKGVFPAFEESIYNDGNPENRVRNVERTTIAPTGTISMVYNVSSGIEPLFAVTYRKNIRGGDSLVYVVPSFLREAEKRGLNVESLIPLIEANRGSIQVIEGIPEDLKEIFKTSHDLSYEAHILMQAAFQEKTDNAVSKTINMKKEASVEDVKNAYMLAWKTGCKGITVYRDGSKEVQVLEVGSKKTKENGLEKKVGTIENPLKIPGVAPAIKIKQRTPLGNMHVSIIIDPKRDYAPIETFGSLGNAGGTEAADIEAVGRLTSMWLRSGGPIEKIIEQLKNIGSGVATVSRDGEIQSLPMAFARALQKYQILREIGKIEDLLLGKVDLEEIDREVSDFLRKGKIKFNNEENNNSNTAFVEKLDYIKEKCPDCGNMIVFEEGCKKCYSCGFSKC